MTVKEILLDPCALIQKLEDKWVETVLTDSTVNYHNQYVKRI